jgi:hypothetical protein
MLHWWFLNLYSTKESSLRLFSYWLFVVYRQDRTRSTHSFFTALCSASAFSDATCNTVCVVHMYCKDVGSYEYDINDLERPPAQTGNNELRNLGVQPPQAKFATPVRF